MELAVLNTQGKETGRKVVLSDAVFGVEDAERVFGDIWQRGKIPLLVGGTGLYLKSLLHGMTLGQQESDPAVRARYEAIAAEPDGKAKLHALLEKVDEETARRLHPNDLRRVVRALERA